MSAAPPSSVPPDVVRDVTGFARALVAAIRVRRMYGAAHPASAAPTDRCWVAATALAAHPGVEIGVSPANLLAGGDLLPQDRRVAEAAAVLHDHDILRIRVVKPPSRQELADFLQLLNADPDTVRGRGGPARLWRESGYPCFELDQIDYDSILSAGERSPAAGGAHAGRGPGASQADAPAAPRDGIWNALVRSMSGQAAPYSRSARDRLLQIARSADDILSFATEAAQAQTATAGATRRSAQAATVLTAFERMVSQIESAAPDQAAAAIRNIAAAASRMDPLLVMDAVSESAESGLGGAAIRAMGDCLDDDAIARLLATAMAEDGGEAGGRLAGALHTLAPDPGRRGRILDLASGTGDLPGAGPGAGDAPAWTALRQILQVPAATLYTSADFAFQLHEAQLRAHRLRLHSPDHLEAWIASVSAESIRALSVTLLIDLFALEESPAALVALAADMGRLAEDLLAAADIQEADRVLQALDPDLLAGDERRTAAARLALERLAASDALRDMGAAMAEVDEDQYEWFQSCCEMLGPAVVPALLPVLVASPDGLGSTRLFRIIAGTGAAAAPYLAALLGNPEWPACRTAIRLLGQIGGPIAAAALQPLVTSADPQRVREAVAAILRLDDPDALRPLAALLGSGAGSARHEAVDVLAASEDARAAALLAAALRETPPLGDDHRFARHLLEALRRAGDEHAVTAIAESMRAFSWVRLTRTLSFKRAAVRVLASMNNARAADALAQAAGQGDVLLRRLAKTAVRARG